ncbi:MAG TPA: hypothetical protein VFU71_07950 [Burkholderiaceae bacterium]|nr:hypothetical protein [Burkholderiaceae bacterium]
MIEIRIPGAEPLTLEHLILDFNGTLALDGHLLPGVAQRLRELANVVSIHVVTADTFGIARQALADLPVRSVILPQTAQAVAKQRYAQALGARRCAAIGNGRNDELLLASVGLSIVVVQGEGAARESLLAASLVAPEICTALDLLLHPTRLTATLRR